MREGVDLKVRGPGEPLRTKVSLLIIFTNLNDFLLRSIIRPSLTKFNVAISEQILMSVSCC